MRTKTAWMMATLPLTLQVRDKTDGGIYRAAAMATAQPGPLPTATPSIRNGMEPLSSRLPVTIRLLTVRTIWLASRPALPRWRNDPKVGAAGALALWAKE